ncbi:MAG TPA: hypothetical protein VJK51_05435 [Candidatus Nanoarchaeia archaeon]|nr:hypothetical protein [Candidatus Nanoarchaeia archaeon]
MIDAISVQLGKNIEKDLTEIEKKGGLNRTEVIKRLLAKAIQERIGFTIEDIEKEIKVDIKI